MATTESASEGRVVFAFFAQPLVVALLAFCLFPVIEYSGRSLHGGRSVDMLDAAIAVAAGGALAAVFVVGLAAVPAYVWLSRRGTITRKQVVVSGVLLGNLPGVIIVSLQALAAGGGGSHNVSFGVAEALRAALISSLVGAAAALVFWSMAGLPEKETS